MTPGLPTTTPRRIARRSLVAIMLGAIIFTVALGQQRPWERRMEDIPSILDSLAGRSVGPYVHLEIYGCPGKRCEARVSLWRESEDEPFTYRGYAWIGLPDKPQFRGFTAELRQDDAGVLFASARNGILKLVEDSATVDRFSGRYWLRARYGSRVVSINGASLASNAYRDTTSQGLASVFESVRDALLRPVRERK